MVAGSRSSLRRPKLRGDHVEVLADKSTRDRSRSRDESAKRPRYPSIAARDRHNKRRKVTNTIRVPELKIPLRGRKAVSPRIITQSLPVPAYNSPLPSPQTQYDQIKKIEEKARVAIRGGVFDIHDEKRSLRSQDGGSRSKSELAQYFSNYEQLLSLEPAPREPLNPETRVILIDDTPGFQPQKSQSAIDPFGASKPLHNTIRVDFTQIAAATRRQLTDPLGPDAFVKVHKKEERREKQIRNNEKEKAQHEKYQLERLLAELRGPDWLRTMGISGVTDTEKKKYEPRRVHFIREIKTMIEKYEAWKVKEKRQRRRELEIAAADDADSEDADDEAEDWDNAVDSSATASPEADVKSESYDVDALAARQLLQEASSAHKPRKRPLVPLGPPPLQPPPDLQPYKAFVSFYDKRHLRDAALGSHGRRSRGVTAFGHPVPECDEEDFELPADYLTDEAIRASQRRRRRFMRSTD